jgi:nitrite reductase/ring-hydroxylating ferredoxin subunit
LSHHWIKIFETEEEMKNNIPIGRTQSIVAKGNKICLAHSKDGVFAVADKCPHNGASLSQGHCTEDNLIVCPLHRYPFDLKTGKATAGMAISVKTYPIRIENDGVYLGIKAKWWES